MTAERVVILAHLFQLAPPFLLQFAPPPRQKCSRQLQPNKKSERIEIVSHMKTNNQAYV